MSVARFVHCDKKFYNSSCANKWNWEWISVEVEVKDFEEVKKEPTGMQFQEDDVAGAALCIVCHKDV